MIWNYWKAVRNTRVFFDALIELNKAGKFTRGYEKVRRLMQWNRNLLSYAYKFCREYKTTNVLSAVKIYVRYVEVNHFIIKYILYGRSPGALCWVPWCSTTSLFFHVTLYISIHFGPSTQSQIPTNNLFYMNIKSDEMLSEIDNIVQKMRV